MNDLIPLPPSFVAIYQPPGSQRPQLPLREIAERHDLCEDMAQMLAEPARTLPLALGITEADVLARMAGVAGADDTGLSPAEAVWVVRRLAEVLGWPDPGADQPARSGASASS
ncbi:ATPase with chaperone activity [Rubrivivax gelatinosus]|uniref:ATPase with chaperone activity n=1 Tax=Rubrivivax gelatinosus TaxID=28068 RepID=A0ABS1E2D2_RUBGE|nr:ATPase with chaperone activity [Rubrivivax gelatinosus]MBK1715095.1 ATPase with chaperone activity [Rubrivivax gelatinosus]